jgi:hypothetical protein
MGLQRFVLDHEFDLGDDDAAIVVGRHGEIEGAEIGALLLEGEIAALVRRRCPDDAIWNNGGEESHSSPSNCIFLTIGAAAALAFMAQPSRSGSTNVSRPTLVRTPGRLAAASRIMSKMIPEGTL